MGGLHAALPPMNSPKFMNPTNLKQPWLPHGSSGGLRVRRGLRLLRLGAIKRCIQAEVYLGLKIAKHTSLSPKSNRRIRAARTPCQCVCFHVRVRFNVFMIVFVGRHVFMLCVALL